MKTKLRFASILTAALGFTRRILRGTSWCCNAPVYDNKCAWCGRKQ